MNRRSKVVVEERMCAGSEQCICAEDKAAAVLHFHLRQTDDDAQECPALAVAFEGRLSGPLSNIGALAQTLSDHGYTGVLVKEFPCCQ